MSLRELRDPRPAAGEVRLRVEARRIRFTDLRAIDGAMLGVTAPVMPGHEIVGIVDALGVDVTISTVATYSISVGGEGDPAAVALLLCAGLIGQCHLVKAGNADVLGSYSFTAATHSIVQVARWQGRRTFAFTRTADVDGQAFARLPGATWVGSSVDRPPERLYAAILLAPGGGLIPQALQAVRKGGRVVCGGIHMSEILPRSPLLFALGRAAWVTSSEPDPRGHEDLLHHRTAGRRDHHYCRVVARSRG